MELPLACVIGDLSLVRALGRRGIPVAVVVSERDASATYSRYCRKIVPTPGFVDNPSGSIAALVTWARRQPTPPVLFYQGDHDLLALSRHRRELVGAVRCLLPPEPLLEDLIDKVRFAALVEDRALPGPATCVLSRAAALSEQARSWTHFPAVLKPALRSHWFGSRVQRELADSTQKALRVENAQALREVLPLLAEHETDFILQRAIEGGEERIVSYHAYVREGGEILAEFTGKKLRTKPPRYGLSTYIEITDDPEVKWLGHHVLERIGLFGVMKMDFKRDERDGRLYLLEINPRFNLWHHPATLAGVCLPELVYRDLVEPGSARAPQRVRTGVRWMSAHADLHAVKDLRASGELSLLHWLGQVLTSDIQEDFTLDDPVPGLLLIAGIAQRRLSRLSAHREPSLNLTKSR